MVHPAVPVAARQQVLPHTPQAGLQATERNEAYLGKETLHHRFKRFVVRIGLGAVGPNLARLILVATLPQDFAQMGGNFGVGIGLPLAMENLENMGIPRKVVAFVLPTGYSFNLDGSTLYLSLAAMFVAQAAGVHMPFTTQLLMVLTLMLTSKGVAGVPRA